MLGMTRGKHFMCCTSCSLASWHGVVFFVITEDPCQTDLAIWENFVAMIYDNAIIRYEPQKEIQVDHDWPLDCLSCTICITSIFMDRNSSLVQLSAIGKILFYQILKFNRLSQFIMAWFILEVVESFHIWLMGGHQRIQSTYITEFALSFSPEIPQIFICIANGFFDFWNDLKVGTWSSLPRFALLREKAGEDYSPIH